MYYDKILPFLDQAFMVKNLKEDISIDDILCPIVAPDFDEDILNDRVVMREVPKVLHVLPIGVMVFIEKDSKAYTFKNMHKGKKLKCDVTYVDYSSVAERIVVEGNEAFLKVTNGFEKEDISTDIFINASANHVPLDKKLIEGIGDSIVVTLQRGISIFELISSEVSTPPTNVAESAALDDARKIFGGKKKVIGTIADMTDASMDWMDTYLKTDPSNAEKLPLLLGPTGVFKSATIKELCKKYNYRLIDFRVAFVSRLDFSGLYEKFAIDGDLFSSACPMEELVTCSDGFRLYCRNALKILNEELSRGTSIVSTTSTGNEVITKEEPLTEEQISTLKDMIAQYSLYAKPAVLFFDEITRNKNQGVSGVLTTLLNQKIYGNLTFKECYFVAATNFNLRNPELNEIFQVEQDIDPAYASRFIRIHVNPGDVRERWFSWADGDKTNVEYVRDDNGVIERDAVTYEKKTIKVPTGDKNIHPLIVKFLRANLDEVYNEQIVLDAYTRSDYDTNEAAAQPFPNYRTWELLSNYIYSKSKDNVINEKTICGLVSEDTGNKVVKFLLSNGYTLAPVRQEDELSSYISESLDAGVPSLIIGPSSLGKTSRIKAYAKKNNAELIVINLASMERTDLLGMPTKVSLQNYVCKGAADKALKGVTKRLSGLLDDMRRDPESHLNPMLTERAPDSTIRMQFKKAYDEGRNIILFFDECNRVTSTTVMSIMFEAISDSRIFGIDFSDHKDKVKVVSACNMGGNYSGTESLDSALSARFSVFRKREYDKSDVDSFINYMKTESDAKNVSPLMYNFLVETVSSQGGYDKLLSWMESVEKASIQEAEPSTRSLFSLSKDIKNMAGSRAFNGKVIFDTVDKTNKISTITYMNAVNDRLVALQEFVPTLLKNRKRWAGVKNNEMLKANGFEVDGNYLMDMLEDCNSEILKNPHKFPNLSDELDMVQSVIENILHIDQYISGLRNQEIEYYLGPDAGKDFLNYFNLHFGGESSLITIEMLDDESLIPDFFDQKLGILTLGGEELVKTMLDYTKEFWAYWSDKLPVINYATFLSRAVERAKAVSGDIVNLLFTKMGSELEGLVLKAEEMGNDYIKTMLFSAGFNATDKELDELRASIGAGSNSGSLRAKLL